MNHSEYQIDILIFLVAAIAVVPLFQRFRSGPIRTGFALSQGGEFGFVLFGAALTFGLIPTVLAQTLMAVIA